MTSFLKSNIECRNTGETRRLKRTPVYTVNVLLLILERKCLQLILFFMKPRYNTLYFRPVLILIVTIVCFPLSRSRNAKAPVIIAQHAITMSQPKFTFKTVSECW